MTITPSKWIERFLALPADEKSRLGYDHERAQSVSGYLMEISEEYTGGVYAARREESPEGMQ